MRRPPWLTAPMVGALVVGGVGAAFAWLVGRPPPSAGEPDAPPEVPGERPRAWMRLDDDPIVLRPGERYRGAVKLPWYVPSSAVTDAKVIAYAEKKGFGDVHVTRSAPWLSGADVGVEARWEQGYRDMPRPSALVGAWALRDVVSA